MIQPFAPQTYNYKSPDGLLIAAPEELWKWQAEYEDFTCLRQFDPKTGLFHRVGEINLPLLKSLYVSSSSYRETYVVKIPPHGKLELLIKCFRRGVHLGRPDQANWSTFYVFGYHDLESNEKQYLVIHEDRAEWTDDFNKIISV